VVQRWGVAQHGGEGDHPSVALLGEHRPAAGIGRGAADGRAVRTRRIATVGPRRVGQPDVHLLDRRGRVAESREPLRAAGAAAAGVHHEVGVQNRLAGVQHAEPGDPVAGRRGREAGRVAPVEDVDVRDRPDPGADPGLQQRAAHPQSEEAGMRLAQLPAAVHPPELLLHVEGGRPETDQFVGEPREQLLQRLAATGQEAVRVPALRHAAAGFGVVLEVVALNDGDRRERLAQHPRGHQAGHARAHDDGAVGVPGHQRSLRVPPATEARTPIGGR
jgi:hypothetical protein